MIKRSLAWTLRIGGGIVVVAGILLAGAFLALKYWLLPDISRFRGHIEQTLSAAAGVPISIAQVEARWDRVRPRLTLQGLAIADSSGRPALFLDQVQGTLSWWTLFRGAPRFHSIEVDRPVLAVRRDQRGQLYVAGIAIEQKPDDAGGGFGEWLLKQESLIVNDATVSWRDALAFDTPFILTDLDLRIDNDGSHHRFVLTGRPPAEVAGPLEVRGDLRGQLATRLADWSGEISARGAHADLSALRKYLRLPPAFTSGRGDVSATLRGDGAGQFEVQADVKLEQVVAELRSDGPPLELAALSGRLNYRHQGSGFEVAADQLKATLANKRVLPPGNFRLSLTPGAAGKPDLGKFSATQFELSALQPVLNSLPLTVKVRETLQALAPTGQLTDFSLQWETKQDALVSYAGKGSFSELGWRPLDRLPGLVGLTGTIEASQAGGRLSLDAKNVGFSAPKVLWQPLEFASVAAQTSWKIGERAEVDIQSVRLANRDASVEVKGVYKTVPERPGWVDLTAKFVDIDGAAIYRYVPRILGEPLRVWLKNAIQAGKGPEANLVLKGDMYDFPFAGDAGGVFKITAKARGVLFAYAPDWPAIRNVDGELLFHGERMEIRGSGGRLFDTLKIHNALAVIADLAHHDEIIEISGNGSGGLSDGLRLLRESPVREATNGALDALDGSGNINVALKLSLPVRRLVQTKVAGTVALNGASLDDGKGTMPALSLIKGDVRFTESGISAQQLRVQILGGPATVRIANPARGGMQIEASGTASAAGLRGEMKNGAFKYLSGPTDWKASVQIAPGKTTLDATAVTSLFGEPAKFKLTRGQDGALVIDGGGLATPAVLARALDAPAVEYLSGNVDWKARMVSREGKADTQITARAQAFGGPLTLELRDLDADRVAIRASGEADMAALRKSFDAPVLRYLDGRTAWNGEFSLGAKQQRARLTSNLVGVESALPLPLRKSAPTPMRLEIDDLTGGPAAGRQTRIRLGDFGVAQLAFAPGTANKLNRVEVAFGAAPALKAGRDGIWLSGTLPTLDADGWRTLLSPPARKEGDSQQAEQVFPALAGANVKVGKLTLFGRGFTELGVNASQTQPGAWQLAFSGPEVNGAATWRSEAGGAFTGRFKTLIIPPPTRAGPSDDLGEAPVVREAGTVRYPAVRVTAEDFRIGARKLGHLDLDALPQGQDWRMRSVSIKNPNAVFSADGIWQGWLKRPQTSMNVQLSAKDIGSLLGDLGYPNTVKGGTAELTGSLSWLGESFALNPPTLSGNLAVSAKSGQFLKAEPGAAKLLGILSLQSLPRRITLDFRDVFSSGFAFNEIAGTVAITRGVMKSDNLTMWGPSATVGLTGSADVANETQDLSVKVVPSLGETVAIAGALAAGPAAGAAAYVVQKILRNPIDKAFGFEYKVTGGWADPVVAKVARPAPEKPRLLR